LCVPRGLRYRTGVDKPESAGQFIPVAIESEELAADLDALPFAHSEDPSEPDLLGRPARLPIIVIERRRISPLTLRRIDHAFALSARSL